MNIAGTSPAGGSLGIGGAGQGLVGHLAPVLLEGPLQVGHHRAPHPHRRVPPLLGRAPVAQPRGVNAEAAGDRPRAVHHDDLAVVARQRVGQRSAIVPAHLAAGLSQLLFQAVVELQRSERVDQDPAVHARALLQRLQDRLTHPARGLILPPPDVRHHVDARPGGAHVLDDGVEHGAVLQQGERGAGAHRGAGLLGQGRKQCFPRIQRGLGRLAALAPRHPQQQRRQAPGQHPPARGPHPEKMGPP